MIAKTAKNINKSSKNKTCKYYKPFEKQLSIDFKKNKKHLKMIAIFLNKIIIKFIMEVKQINFIISY
jgi:hypothetical protein